MGYLRIFKNYGARKVLSQVLRGREGRAICAATGSSRKMTEVPLPEWKGLRDYSFFHTRSNCINNRCSPRLDAKQYERNHPCNHVDACRSKCFSRQRDLIVPALMGSAAVGGSSKGSHSPCIQISDWLQSVGKHMKNSVTLYAADDGIPDIKALAKDISEYGIQRIEEAQRILQQKLKDAKEEVQKTKNTVWKMFLVLMVDSLEEALCELGKIKEQVVRELNCQREQPPKE